MTETFYATQQVRVLTGQGWPPAGIECCVVRGRCSETSCCASG